MPDVQQNLHNDCAVKVKLLGQSFASLMNVLEKVRNYPGAMFERKVAILNSLSYVFKEKILITVSQDIFI